MDVSRVPNRLAELVGDVAISSLATGKILSWNGTKWVATDSPHLFGNLTVEGTTLINGLSFNGPDGLFDTNLGASVYQSDPNNASFLAGELQLDLNTNIWKFNSNPIALNDGTGGTSNTGFGKLHMDGGAIIGDVYIKATNHDLAGQTPFKIADSLGNELLTLLSYGPNNNAFYLGGNSFAQMFYNTAYFATGVDAIFRSGVTTFGHSSIPNSAGDGEINRAFIIKPYYSQSGSAAATDLLVNRQVTSVGSGDQLLLDLQVNDSSLLRVHDTGGMEAFANNTDVNGTPFLTINNASAVGQTTAFQFITNGVFTGRLRNDYAGNLNYIAGFAQDGSTPGDHIFECGGDLTTPIVTIASGGLTIGDSLNLGIGTGGSISGGSGATIGGFNSIQGNTIAAGVVTFSGANTTTGPSLFVESGVNLVFIDTNGTSYNVNLTPL